MLRPWSTTIVFVDSRFFNKENTPGAKDRHSTQEENIQFDTEVVQNELIDHFWQKCSIALSKKKLTKPD